VPQIHTGHKKFADDEEPEQDEEVTKYTQHITGLALVRLAGEILKD